MNSSFCCCSACHTSDGHRFQTLSSLDAYIDTLEYRKESFAAEQQELEFYAEYAGVIAERGSEFHLDKQPGGTKRI